MSQSLWIIICKYQKTHNTHLAENKNNLASAQVWPAEKQYKKGCETQHRKHHNIRENIQIKLINPAAYLMSQFAIRIGTTAIQKFSAHYNLWRVMDVRTSFIILTFSKPCEKLAILLLSSQPQSSSVQAPTNFFTSQSTSSFLWISDQLIAISNTNISAINFTQWEKYSS